MKRNHHIRMAKGRKGMDRSTQPHRRAIPGGIQEAHQGRVQAASSGELPCGEFDPLRGDFRKDSGPAFTAYHGVSAADHQKRFNSLTKKGWRPKNISVTSINGKRFYAALYDKGPSGSLLAKSFLTGSQYQQQSNANKSAGRQLLGGAAVHLSGTIVAPVPLSMGCTPCTGLRACLRSPYAQPPSFLRPTLGAAPAILFAQSCRRPTPRPSRSSRRPRSSAVRVRHSEAGTAKNAWA